MKLAKVFASLILLLAVFHGALFVLHGRAVSYDDIYKVFRMQHEDRRGSENAVYFQVHDKRGTESAELPDDFDPTYEDAQQVLDFIRLREVIVDMFNVKLPKSESASAGALLQAFVKRIPSESFAKLSRFYKEGSRGIVYLGGGRRYLPATLLSIVQLRMTGCTLPVELWLLDDEKPSQSLLPFLEKYSVRTRIMRLSPSAGKRKAGEEESASSILSMYGLKPFSLLFSEFDEVMFLDSDNYVTKDPTYLFDDPRLQSYSGVFWPDYWLLRPQASIWSLIGGMISHGRAQESGMIIVRKSLGGFRPLTLAAFFNFHNNVFYFPMYWKDSCGVGDKDTFQIAWHTLNAPQYMMPPPGVVGAKPPPNQGPVAGTVIAQHDLDLYPLFFHSNAHKWDYVYFWRTNKLATTPWTLYARYKYDNSSLTRYNIDTLPGEFGRWHIVLQNDPTIVHNVSDILGYDIKARFNKLAREIFSMQMMRDYTEADLNALVEMGPFPALWSAGGVVPAGVEPRGLFLLDMVHNGTESYISVTPTDPDFPSWTSAVIKRDFGRSVNVYFEGRYNMRWKRKATLSRTNDLRLPHGMVWRPCPDCADGRSNAARM